MISFVRSFILYRVKRANPFYSLWFCVKYLIIDEFSKFAPQNKRRRKCKSINWRYKFKGAIHDNNKKKLQRWSEYVRELFQDARAKPTTLKNMEKK